MSCLNRRRAKSEIFVGFKVSETVGDLLVCFGGLYVQGEWVLTMIGGGESQGLVVSF